MDNNTTKLPGEANATPATNNVAPTNDGALITSQDINSMSGSSFADNNAGAMPTVNKQQKAQEVADQLENLSGELQSLQSKMDKMSPTSTAPSAEPPAKIEMPTTPILPEKSESEEKPAEEPKPAPAPEAPANGNIKINVSTTKPQGDSDKMNDIKPNNEIYDKVIGESKAKDASQSVEHKDSPLGMVGEFMIMVGILLLIVLVVLPFFKETIGASIWDMTLSYGWLGALGVLFVGICLSFMQKGMIALKVISILMLLVFGAVYASINGYLPVTQLNDLLQPIFKL